MLRGRAEIAATILRLKEYNPLGVFLICIRVPFSRSHVVCPRCTSMLQMKWINVIGQKTAIRQVVPLLNWQIMYSDKPSEIMLMYGFIR